ncbi:MULTISPECIES: hypothetical protein [unclassified Cupriavidus]|uniref:hypothetical protein n=1 Tax=unclassified Cupriavidus TaxID=2640874 RepID=UPI001AE92552|nr:MULTISPECIES: hypothetical protein [unclassified Cupriavidus]MBP0633483.1 hypothetical protein [Cupriavidus sp. AcVe19-1a]MBP0639875.1 hypothetical protein [Cupriavidus sp. AcVe19-6a]
MADQVENLDFVGDGEQLRFLLVDTNCFLRIYQTSLRPILGADVGGFRIRTLTDLVDEFRQGKRLQDEYAWANGDIDAAVAAGAVLALNDDELKAVLEECQLVKRFGNALLENYCTQRLAPIPVRSLSTNDATLIATALVLNAVIATDEWPMTHVVQDLIQEDERNVEIWNSFDLLHLLERAGCISAEDRYETVKSWIRYGEALPHNWETQYRRLFNEPAPKLQ